MTPKQTGEHYDQIAEWWLSKQMQNPEYGMRHIRRAIKHAKQSAKVLDVGCGGTGRTTAEFLKSDCQVTGIDVSAEMIRLAKRQHPQVNFIHADVIAWETTESFDLIVAWDSIFHAPKDLQEQAIAKMCELLNPEGILLFTAGAHTGEVSGEMNGVLFEYGTIGYRGCLDVIENMGCQIILLELDQHPANHVVLMCQKA